MDFLGLSKFLEPYLQNVLAEYVEGTFTLDLSKDIQLEKLQLKPSLVPDGVQSGSALLHRWQPRPRQRSPQGSPKSWSGEVKPSARTPPTSRQVCSKHKTWRRR